MADRDYFTVIAVNAEKKGADEAGIEKLKLQASQTDSQWDLMYVCELDAKREDRPRWKTGGKH